MRVLVACEFSGTVRDAFTAQGHDAWSCDLLPTESSGNHIQGDVLEVLNDGWDLMIAHPPCTYLTVTANRWLKDQPMRASNRLVGAARREARQEAIEFFMQLWNAPIFRIAIENPIGCMSTVFQKPQQIIQPHWFGDATTKATCLWLKNLPYLEATTRIEPEFHITSTGKKYPKWSMIEACKIHDLDERSKFRSKTFQGIADAMADQWTSLDGTYPAIQNVLF